MDDKEAEAVASCSSGDTWTPIYLPTTLGERYEIGDVIRAVIELQQHVTALEAVQAKREAL